MGDVEALVNGRHATRFRFSVRTVLVVLTACCVWLGWQVERARRQRDAVAHAREMGWEVNYDYECQSDGGRSRYNPPAVSRSPDWLTELLGIDFFHNVVRVRPSGADLAPLADLPHVKWVSLESNAEIVDLLPLTVLSDLRVLPLNNTQIGDLASLARMTSLEYLNLRHTNVSELAPLAGLSRLKRLDLEDTRISDVTVLAGLSNLESVNLCDTLVSEVGVERLREALPKCSITVR